MPIQKELNTKTEDGKPLKLNIKSPTALELQKAQMESNKVFRMAVESRSLLRANLTRFLIEQGLWSEDTQKRLEELGSKIYAKEKLLLAGGMKRSEAKAICLEIKEYRLEQAKLLFAQRQHDIYTAESQAENAKFDFLVSVCVLNEEGERYFKNLDDYKNRATEEAAAEAAGLLAEIVNGYDPEWENKLPENRFLLQHGFVNDKFQFINKAGELVDSEGRRIDSDGNYINDKGEFINLKGELVDNDGLPVVEFKPLIDDDDEVKDTNQVTKEENVPV